MNRWMSFSEVCLELGLGYRAVTKLLQKGILVGYRLPRDGTNKFGKNTGQWRILDPGHKFARYIEESKRRIEHVPLLSGREVAEVLGVTPAAIRQLKRRKNIRGQKDGNIVLYTATEIRRLLFKRERSSRDGKRKYSPIIANWLKSFIEGEEWSAAEVLAELMRQAITLPEPIKSRYVVRLWDQFDRLNKMLCEIKNLSRR